MYFIQAGAQGGPIKIGFTRGDPFARMRNLQTAHHTPLRMITFVPTTIDDESWLHTMLRNYRLHGEWFRDCGNLRALIREMVLGTEDVIDREQIGALVDSEAEA